MYTHGRNVRKFPLRILHFDYAYTQTNAYIYCVYIYIYIECIYIPYIYDYTIRNCIVLQEKRVFEE